MKNSKKNHLLNEFFVVDLLFYEKIPFVLYYIPFFLCGSP